MGEETLPNRPETIPVRTEVGDRNAPIRWITARVGMALAPTGVIGEETLLTVGWTGRRLIVVPDVPVQKQLAGVLLLLAQDMEAHARAIRTSVLALVDRVSKMEKQDEQ